MPMASVDFLSFNESMSSMSRLGIAGYLVMAVLLAPPIAKIKNACKEEI